MSENNMDNNKIDGTPSLKQVFIMIAVLFCLAFCFTMVSALEDARVWETDIIKLDENVKLSCNINDVSMGKYIEFDSCYAEIPGEAINSWDVTVVLKPMNSDKGLYIPTYMTDSATDIVTYQNNEGKYNRTLFSANVASDKLSLSDTQYDIILYYNNNNREVFVDTGYDLTQEGLR
ncbi:MAG: hypothetical protein E7263_05425 [Lachnospiraceae bacterium]|nr:hypothetical protein [Lachnospiraceae bacterium]